MLVAVEGFRIKYTSNLVTTALPVRMLGLTKRKMSICAAQTCTHAVPAQPQLVFGDMTTYFFAFFL